MIRRALLRPMSGIRSSCDNWVRKGTRCGGSLISPSSDRTISSTLGELDRPPVTLDMNPADAEARGIDDGDAIRMFNNLGETRVRAKLSHLVRSGTVAMPKGVWRRHTANGFTSNALVPDSLSDLGGGACFNDARVQVEKTSNEQ